MTGRAGVARADNPLLFVTLGTDPHPFSRLLRWVGAWGADHWQWRVEIQRGVTPAPRFGHALAYCREEDKRTLFQRAAIVVSHAAPAEINAARAMGHVPVVVARDPTLGEYPDDGQILFSRRLGAARLIWLAESQVGLSRAIRAALAAAAPPADGDEARRVVQELRRETVELAEGTPSRVLTRSPSLVRDLAAEIGDMSPKLLELATTVRGVDAEHQAELPRAQDTFGAERTIVAREQFARDADDSQGYL